MLNQTIQGSMVSLANDDTAACLTMFSIECRISPGESHILIENRSLVPLYIQYLECIGWPFCIIVIGHAPLDLFSHSAGVKHFGVHACMAAISSLSAELTSRCRARVVFFSNRGDTMTASKDCPHPPVNHQ